MLTFTYDTTLSAGQIAILKERHQFAFDRILNCTSLSPSEKADLTKAYGYPVKHGTTSPASPTHMATTFWSTSGGVTSYEIRIVLPNFFQSPGVLHWEEERAMTLIHEMMHVAGYDHPKPGEPGYAEAAPLRAEVCVAGRYSDVACLPDATGSNLVYLKFASSRVVSETA